MKFSQILTIIIVSKINIIFGASTFTDKIIAIVNHDIILKSDITNKIHFNTLYDDTPHHNSYTVQKNPLYYTILDQLIINNLILQIAAQENITINLNQIQHIIENDAHIRNMTTKQFNTYLDSIGLSQDKYFLEIYQETLKNIICNQMVYQYTDISPNEINKIIYKLNFIDFNKKFKLTHMIITLPIQPSPTKINQAKEFAKLLIAAQQTHQNIPNFIRNYYYKHNNLFPRITMRNSTWTTWEQIPIIFDQHLKTVKPGDIIGPIYSHDGIHILKIEDINTETHLSPIIKVKINDLISKDTSYNINIKQKLLDIKKQIENEESTFTITLQEKSNDFYSEHNGNSVEWINLNQFDPSIQKSLLSLKKNQITIPIYNNGWRLIKLIDINKINYSNIIYERAYLHLLHQKFDETLYNWIQELKYKSYIKIIN